MQDRCVIAFVLALAAAAQTAAAQGDQKSRPLAGNPCLDVEVGGQHATNFDCLTERLRDAAHVHPAVAPAAPNPGSPPQQIGLYNHFGNQERIDGQRARAQSRPAASPAAALLASKVAH